MCKFILKADDGKFVMKKLNNGQLGLYAAGNQENEALVLESTRINSATPSEPTRVMFNHGNEYVTLHGTTVVLDQNGAVANRPFVVIWLGCNKVALRGVNGKYVSRETLGSDKLHANRDQIGAWEIFDLIEVN